MPTANPDARGPALAAAARSQQARPPATMRAVMLRSFGAPEELHLETVATPAPGPDEVLARVGAVEVSRTRDVATRSGRHPFSQSVTLPHVLGGDCAGTVVATGPGVDPALLGRRVAIMNHHTCGECGACLTGRGDYCSALRMLGIHRWGSYAEYAAVWADGVHPIPDDLPFPDAAAMAATGPVAATQLEAARVAPGDWLLLTGATGALAATIASLARPLGARVIALSRRPGLVPASLHATVLDSTRPDLPGAILTVTGGAAPGAVIDNVCAPDVFESYFTTLAHGSRIVVSGAIAAPAMPLLPVPARELYSRSIALLGVRSHSVGATARFWQYVRDGYRLPRGLLHVRPLSEAAAAHRAVEAQSRTGHTVLSVDDEQSAGSGGSR